MKRLSAFLAVALLFTVSFASSFGAAELARHAIAGPPQKGDSEAVQSVIRLPPDMKAGVGQQLKIAAESAGKKIRWRLVILDPKTSASIEPDSAGRWVFFAAQTPGRFLVQAWTAMGDEPSDIAECIVTVGADVVVKPKGDKEEPPVKLVKGAFVIIIADLSKASAELGALLNSTLGEEVKALGHNYKVLDITKDGATINEKGYGKHIQTAGGIPCLLVFVPTGKGQWSVHPSALPVNKADVLKVIKDKTGA